MSRLALDPPASRLLMTGPGTLAAFRGIGDVLRKISITEPSTAGPCCPLVVRKQTRQAGDLVLIDRIGENPQGLIGHLRESCFAQRSKRNATRNSASWPPALVVLLASGGDCGPGEN